MDVGLWTLDRRPCPLLPESEPLPTLRTIHQRSCRQRRRLDHRPATRAPSLCRLIRRAHARPLFRFPPPILPPSAPTLRIPHSAFRVFFPSRPPLAYNQIFPPSALGQPDHDPAPHFRSSL